MTFFTVRQGTISSTAMPAMTLSMEVVATTPLMVPAATTSSMAATATTSSSITPVLTPCAVVLVMTSSAHAASLQAAAVMTYCKPPMSGLVIPIFSTSVMVKTSSTTSATPALIRLSLVVGSIPPSFRSIALALIYALSSMPMTSSPSKTGSPAVINTSSRYTSLMAPLGMSTPSYLHQSSLPAAPTPTT